MSKVELSTLVIKVFKSSVIICVTLSSSVNTDRACRLKFFNLVSSSVQQQAQTSEQPVIQLCFRKRAELSMQRIGFCVNALWVTLRIFPSRRSLPRYCDSKNLSFIPPSAAAALLSHLYHTRNPDLRISVMGKNGLPNRPHHYSGMDDLKSLIKMFLVSLHL